MDLNKIDFLKFKNACLIRTNVLMASLKILLFVLICQTLKHFFKLQDFWIIPVWLSLTVLIDGFLILKKPKVFDKIDLSEEDQQVNGLNPEELSKYLYFSPKIRLGRTLFATCIALIFFKSSDWANAFLTAVFLGFIILDPILKRLFNIKTPLIYKNSNYKFPKGLDERHRNDPFWPGSGAWTALRSTRQFDNYPKL